MIRLAFPEFQFKTEIQGQRKFIFDVIRKKFIPLTPEEWVRQHVIRTCIENYHIPPGLVAVEKGLQFNGRNKRFDVLVLSAEGQPQLLVECKAPSVRISTETLFQSSVYLNQYPSAYLWLTNGLEHYWKHCKDGVWRDIDMPGTLK